MNDNQILIIHSRGVYNFMGKIWCHNIAEECTILWAKFGVITVFHCSVITHWFQKFVSDLGTFFQLCTNKIPIEFALGDEHKRLAFLIWDIFCWACCQWRELALVIRKVLLFLIIHVDLLISPLTVNFHKRCPRLGMQCVCVHPVVQTQ